MRTRPALVVIAAIVLIAGALFAWHVVAVERELFDINSRHNSLRMYAFGLTMFQNSLPRHSLVDAQGNALSSWRFLQHIATGPDVSQYLREPWDGELNASFRVTAPDDFCFDGDSDTNIFAIIGEHSAFDPTLIAEWTEVPANTIIIVECHNRHVHWMEPGDIDSTEFAQWSARGLSLGEALGAAPLGVHVAFANTGVMRLDPATPCAAIADFIDVTRSAKADRAALEKFEVSQPTW